MKKKILAIMIEDLSWMYYGKYRQYLHDLNHPFKKNIDFIIDTQMSLSSDIISQYPVVVFYHRDPLKILYPKVYKYAKNLEKICLNYGIRLVNKPDILSRTSKFEQLNILRNKNFFVAHAFTFNTMNNLNSIDSRFYPLFIRNNDGHDSDNLTMEGPFNTFRDLQQRYIDKSFDDKPHLSGKVAIQYIDTRSSDNMYRRYRAFVCGNNVVTGNLHISKDWYVHGINANYNSSALDEHNFFVSNEYVQFEKDFFTKVNNSLGFGFSAIDYGYTKDGRIVVWEVNPHPAFPAWVDKEPMKTKVTNFLSEYYHKILEKSCC